MLTKSEKKTLRIYEKYANGGEVDSTGLWADAFSMGVFRGFPAGGRLIDIGCGSGRAVPLLRDLMIEDEGYLGIDPSPAQVRLAKELHPLHKFEVGNIYDVGKKYPAHFDGFWCSCVLMHIPRHKLPKALRSLRTCLKEGAVGLISTPRGVGNVLNTDEMLLTLLEFDELTQFFTDAGFSSRLHSPYGDMILGEIQAV
ncbi:MAG: class I SAM-dependent methyltransferase [Patescibacteria group bacterium]